MYRIFLQIDVESAIQATEARRAYEGSTMLEFAIWKSKIAEQTDGNINLLTPDMRVGCRIDSLYGWLKLFFLMFCPSSVGGEATTIELVNALTFVPM
jgi:hypothetical protein